MMIDVRILPARMFDGQGGCVARLLIVPPTRCSDADSCVGARNGEIG
jgi:hypothetical protein